MPKVPNSGEIPGANGCEPLAMVIKANRMEANILFEIVAKRFSSDLEMRSRIGASQSKRGTDRIRQPLPAGAWKADN
jgi:hypothetical protein